MSKTQPESYQALKQQLDEILQKLQQDDVDIDRAVAYHKKGIEIIAKLEKYLTTAQNEIAELSKKPGKGSK